MENKLDIIKKEFANYLTNLGISPKTHKNYRSDLNHFTGWAILKIRALGSYVETLSETIPFLSSDLAREYKNYMAENITSDKTINRRLSTVRHLSRFLTASQMIDSDFMEGIENVNGSKAGTSTVSPLINEFRSYLVAEKVSDNTIKNYLSDIRQFLNWLENNHAQPT